MKSVFCLAILMSLLLFSGCKKEKPTIFSGQLLLTSKLPYALSNRKIEIYQPGSPSAIGINSGSTSSTTKGVTNANGYFRLSFIPGKSFFIIFSGTNANSLILSNSSEDTSFPEFSRKNFPEAGYDPAKPVFIGKTIDTAIIKVNLVTDLTVRDTIGLQTYTTGGRVDKQYIGRSASAGSVIILDTISNMLFTHFDCSKNAFVNTLYAGRKWTTALGYVTISSEGVVSPSELSAADETKKEIMFYFRK